MLSWLLTDDSSCRQRSFRWGSWSCLLWSIVVKLSLKMPAFWYSRLSNYKMIYTKQPELAHMAYLFCGWRAVFFSWMTFDKFSSFKMSQCHGRGTGVFPVERGLCKKGIQRCGLTFRNLVLVVQHDRLYTEIFWEVNVGGGLVHVVLKFS